MATDPEKEDVPGSNVVRPSQFESVEHARAAGKAKAQEIKAEIKKQAVDNAMKERKLKKTK